MIALCRIAILGLYNSGSTAFAGALPGKLALRIVILLGMIEFVPLCL